MPSRSFIAMFVHSPRVFGLLFIGLGSVQRILLADQDTFS